jgi:undecaprenyl-diphosphatase
VFSRVEERVLGAWERPAPRLLDGLFRASHQLGRTSVCAGVVAAAALWHLSRRERSSAALWLGLGASTFALQAGLKRVAGRERPRRWRRGIEETGYSFPSGHALASATLYPLLARSLTRRRAGWSTVARGLGAGIAAAVGLGRVYLGLHWPSDVVAGWLLGAGQLALGEAAVRRFSR